MFTTEERQALIERRKVEFPKKYPGDPDFCPAAGRCYRCGTDLVVFHGELFPTAFITGCPKCHRSYCD